MSATHEGVEGYTPTHIPTVPRKWALFDGHTHHAKHIEYMTHDDKTACPRCLETRLNAPKPEMWGFGT